MKRETIALVLAMAVAMPAAALNAPTLAVSKGGDKLLERGPNDVRKPAQGTDFEPDKSKQHWQDIPLPENITRARGLVRA